MEKGEYVLSGAFPVQDDLDAEQIDRVSRHLGGIATVYLAHDDVAHSVSIRISGTMPPDDTRIVEKRIEKFAEEYCSAGAILLSEWNGLSRWLVVGMNWQGPVSAEIRRGRRAVCPAGTKGHRFSGAA